MFKHFARGFSLEDDAFAGLEAKDIDGGVVIDEQVAWLSARVVGRHEAGDHWIYLGQVVAAGCDELRPPYVHVRRNGFSY
jgi:flavin reductase (DIM6/NTAB) family NADH-FMN oxidoreductase RutF